MQHSEAADSDEGLTMSATISPSNNNVPVTTIRRKFNTDKRGYLRKVLVALFLLCFVFIFLGAGLNDLNHKYVRALPHKDCQRELLILSVKDSAFCCESGLHQTDWVCVAAYDNLNRLLTSMKSYIIPLMPLLLTVVSDFIVGGGNVDKNIFIGVILRLVICFLIFLFRLGLLYLGANVVQGLLQGVLHYGPHDNHTCWYADWVLEQKCKEDFDFSDHIVLILVHYMLPVAMELAVLYSRAFTLPGSIRSIMMQYSLPLLACVVLVLVCCRSLLLTAMYFHTTMECLVAVAIALLLGFLPLYLLDGSTFWTACLRGPKTARSKL